MTSYTFRWKTASTLDEALAHIHNKCEGLIYKRKDAGAEVTKLLTDALSGNRNCRAVDFCSNNTGIRGMAAFSELVTSPLNNLTVLCLHSNGIRAEGAEHLAGALRNPYCKLTEIYLGNNGIGDTGAKALAASLYTNRYVRALFLARNAMTDVGGRACADAVKVNPSIRILQLKQDYRAGLWLNTISESILEEVRGTIKAKVAKQKQAFKELLNKNGAPWMRAKLMVVGQGRAGKTATIRSLTCEDFDPKLKSTLGASVSQTKASVGAGGWSQLDEGADLVGAFTRRFVTTRLIQEVDDEEREEKEETTSLVESLPRSGVNGVRRLEASRDQVPTQLNGAIRERFEGIEFLYDKSDDYQLSFSIWDYGGQRVFYTLHHLFLTEYGVYLLVFDMHEILEHKEATLGYLKFWLNSTKLHAPAAPVVLVGTHMDKVNSPSQLKLVNDILHGLMKENFPQTLANESFELGCTEDKLLYFPIDNTNGKGADDIRAKIESVAREAEYVNQHVPLSWVEFIDKLLQAKDVKWMKLAAVEKVAKGCGITSSKELDAMLGFFHEIGSIVHFTETEAMRSIVTLSPQWLMDGISKVIRDGQLHGFNRNEIATYQLETDVDLLFTKGLATRDLLEYVWKNEHVQFMLELMKQTLLLSDWEFGVAACSEDLYLVPSMLKSDTVDVSRFEGRYSAVFDFSETFLPHGLYERLLCLCVAHSATVEGTNEPILTNKIGVVWLERDSAIVVKIRSEQIEVRFENSKKIETAFRIVNAVLQKIKREVMNGRLHWETLLRDERKGKSMSLQSARNKKLGPWFSNGKLNREIRASSATAMFNIGAFDSL